MAKKKSPKPAASKATPPPNPKAAESLFRDIAREIGDREFASIEEAQAFIGELMSSGRVDAGRLVGAPPPMTPLDRAIALVDEAYDADGAARITLFVRALATSWECVDAYVGLAEECAATPEESHALYTVALEMAEKTLAPKIRAEVGHYWGYHETRPYMRARRGLADALFLMGEVEAALEHYREMMRLNPNDNQGNRYVLLRGLIAVEHLDEARALLAAYDEVSPEWLYGAVLLELTARNSAGAAAVVGEAIASNRHVPAFVLGRRKMPRTLPPLYSMGSVEEAIIYAYDWAGLWKATDGAIEFLDAHAGRA